MFARKRGTGGSGVGALAIGLAMLVCLACNEQRQKECQAFLAAMQPLDAPDGNAKAVPTLETVRGVKMAVAGMKLHDQPLQIYAENYGKTLSVLASTIEVKTSSMAPDGVDDVIKKNLREARADADDVRRYCAQ